MSAEKPKRPKVPVVPQLSFGDGTDPGTRDSLSNPSGTSVQTGNSGGPSIDVSGAPGSVVPGYELLDELGRGAMGVVYRARHVKLNRIVALKMAVGSRIDSRDLIRFLAEAEAVAAVQHENVVQVYDYGESGGRPYMALEYCSGGTLSAMLREEAPLHPLDAAEIVCRIADGVGAAHDLNIVHRDLKPGNILLQVDPRKLAEAGLGPEDFDDLPVADLTPKVSDFGLAKRANNDLTATQAVMGTPSYMSPEQAVGKTKFVGPPADVWALGVILYECLTGERPFRGESTYEVLAQILADEPPSVRTIRAKIPRDLELVVRKCLEKNPADRYPTASELAGDLDKVVRGEPISVRPLSTAARVKRWVRRNPVVSALLTVVVLVTFGLMGSLYAQNRQAVAQVKAERTAKEAAERAADESNKREEAEKAARAAAQTARTETARAELVVRLMSGAFRSTDPLAEFFGADAPVMGVATGAGGQSPALVPFLRNAAALFRKELADPKDALVRAKLLATVGNGLKSMGLYAEAKPILKEVVEIRAKSLKESDPDRWQGELDLGRLEVECGEVTPGLERFVRVRKWQERAGAPKAVILTTRFYEGVGLTTFGDPTGVDVVREVLDERERLLGPIHKDTILAKLALIAALIERGNFVEIMTRANALREDVKKLPDPKLRAVFEAILDAQAKVTIGYGARHGFPLAGDLQSAVNGLKAAIVQLEQALPADHFVVGMFRYALATLLIDLHQEAEADATFARIISDMKQTVGLAHPRWQLLLDTYSHRLGATGRADEARVLFDEFAAQSRERLGPENPWLAMILIKRARFEYQQGNTDGALESARAGVALLKPETFMATPHALVDLLDTARLLNRAAPIPALRACARDLFATTRKIITSQSTPDSPDAGLVAVAEAQSQYETGDRLAAVQSLNGVLPRLPSLRLTQNYWVVLFRTAGRVSLDAGEFVKAEHFFRNALEQAKKLTDDRASTQLELTELLAHTLTAQARHADAIPLWEEVRRQTGANAPEADRAAADLRVAAAQLAFGNRAAHTKTLAAMVERYGKSADVQVLASVGWAGALAPKPDGWDSAAFEEELAAAFEEADGTPWDYRGLALVRVRAGKLDAAEEALKKAGTDHVEDHLIRGLIAVARKDIPAAKLALSHAEVRIGAEKPSPAKPFALADRDWQTQLEVTVLLTELKTAIASAPK
jgi:serine/threonine protein kinase/tetratricopeptide (TPR) repeat protein